MLETRGEPDLIDTWHRFERKVAHKGLDPQRFFERWETGLDWYGPRWTNELADYLGNDCPDFTAVSRALNQHVARFRYYLKT